MEHCAALKFGEQQMAPSSREPELGAHSMTRPDGGGSRVKAQSAGAQGGSWSRSRPPPLWSFLLAFATARTWTCPDRCRKRFADRACLIVVLLALGSTRAKRPVA